MITRVVDAQGRPRHDCADAGCDTSWDGVVIATGAAPDTPASLPAGQLLGPRGDGYPGGVYQLAAPPQP